MKILSIVFGASLLLATSATAADVAITLTGVKAKGGTIRVSLYDDKTFLRAPAPFTAEAKGDAKGDVVVHFHNVPAGDYAIAALHDANDDHAMAQDANGHLTEGTALSHADQLRGMPTFAVAKVSVPAAGASFSISMSYPEDRTGW